MKYYRLTFMTLAGALLLAGCAAEAVDEGTASTTETPTPAPVEQPEITEAASVADDVMPAEDETADEAMPVDEPEAEEMETSQEKTGDSQSEAPVTMVIPRNENQDIEQLPPGSLPQDSIAYTYMIKPNDYLTKIAFNEYGNPNEWRKIYNWNRVRIGDDPAKIFPYHDLDLYKPAAQVTVTPFEYIVHTVASGESLWSIAGGTYNDERAWIVIFWDNEDLLTRHKGLLKPGMELRIRTRLW